MIYLTLDSWGRFSCPTRRPTRPPLPFSPWKSVEKYPVHFHHCVYFQKSIYDEAISNSNTKEIKPTHIKTLFRCVNIS